MIDYITRLEGDARGWIRDPAQLQNDYAVTAFSLKSNQGTTFTVHVTRAHQSYDVHLKLSQLNGTWKVMSYDGV